MGAKRVPASGATPWKKEDLYDDKFLYQHKEITKTHTVTVLSLEQLRQHAIDDGLEPCYIIDTPKRRWFMVDEETWHSLIS